MNNYINDIKTSFSCERKKDAFEFSSLFLFCTKIFSENTVSPTNVSYHHVSVLKKKVFLFNSFLFSHPILKFVQFLTGSAGRGSLSAAQRLPH